MANTDITVPVDPDFDLNAYLNKYKDDSTAIENQPNIFDITSPYRDIDELNWNITKHTNDQEPNCDYTILHLNIQSLPAKFDHLKQIISELYENSIEVDFILLCETFLTEFNSHHFNIHGYNFVYKNRPNSNRGGVALYIHNQYNFKMRDDIGIHIPGIFESIFIEVHSNHLKAIVGEIYRLPNTNELESISRYENIIRKLQNYKNNIIIGTDQNFDYLQIDHHKNTSDLLDIFLTNGLCPTITKPTRIAHKVGGKETQTLIDNIYISTKRKPNTSSAILPVFISDHFPVITRIFCDSFINKKKPKTIQKRQITEAAKIKITNSIKNINWEYLEALDVNEAYVAFYNIINNIKH